MAYLILVAGVAIRHARVHAIREPKSRDCASVVNLLTRGPTRLFRHLSQLSVEILLE